MPRAVGQTGPMFSLHRKPREPVPELGALERRALELLWAQGAAHARELHDQLQQERHLTLSTVQSTLERLHRKGLLRRWKQGRAYCYEAQVSRETLVGRLMADIASELGTDRRRAAIAGLLDAADGADEATLDRLQAWIDRARDQRARRGDA